MSLITRLAGKQKTYPESDIEDIAQIVTNLTEYPSTNFSRYLEQAIKNQLNNLISVTTNVHGIDSSVYNPITETSIYDSEDQKYLYPTEPDYSGRLLIVGLPGISFSGRDQWNTQDVRLFWNQPAAEETEIKENAKIVVNSDYRKVEYRSKNLRRHTGRYFELIQIHQLVPYN